MKDNNPKLLIQSRLISGLGYTLMMAMFCLSFWGCSDSNPAKQENPSQGGFRIEAKYTKIRSYPEGGGGIFPIRLLADSNFSGNVNLQVAADTSLHAQVTMRSLSENNNTAEVIIMPTLAADTGLKRIELVAYRTDTAQVIPLEIEMFNWSSGDSALAMEKREDFIQWLKIEHPEFGDFAGQNLHTYVTYPQILVVEHWTFLDAEWEMRLCFHVMMPPDDWSMIQLRRRGEWDPIFAAKREFNDTIYTIKEIQVSEYPIMCDY